MNQDHFDSNKAYEELRERYNLHFVDLLIKKGYKTYLFGGSLRDMVLGKEWKDADIRAWIPLSAKERDEKMEEILKEAGIEIKSKIIFNEEFTIYRFMPEGSKAQGVIDFTVVSNQFEVIPDFTVNGLYFDIETKELIDPHDALEAIKERVIKTVLPPEEQFTMEPHMIFRAVKFACQFGFDIEESNLKVMADKSKLTEGTFSAVADNTFPGMTEWFIGNIFRGIKYNPVLFTKLWNETGLTKVMIDFISNRFDEKPSIGEMGIPFDPNKKYSYEEALSIFLSEISKRLNQGEAENLFKNILKLFHIDSPSVYGDFAIDIPRIRYQQ